MILPNSTNVRNSDCVNSFVNSQIDLPAKWIEIDPDADTTSPEAVYQAAQRYVEAGLSIIPIDAEVPSKSPDPRRVRSWKIYQLRLPRVDELRAWHESGGPYGLAVLGGAVSGGQRGFGLEIIDFDSIELAAPWIDAVEARSAGLTNKLVMVVSPRPGLHVYYRCAEFGECQKLACAATVDANGHPKRATLIELKAEGGYCLVPPSPRRCHPRSELYRLYDEHHDLASISIIQPEERTILLEEARRFNQWVEPEPKREFSTPRTGQQDGNRPGDDFNRRASWADILEPHGWKLARRCGEIEHWRRPGKSDGISGTVNYAGAGLFYAFSTNAHPFEDGRGYTKFHAYALLNHRGDYAIAAQKLREEGFGAPILAAGKRTGDQNALTTVIRVDDGHGANNIKTEAMR